MDIYVANLNSSIDEDAVTKLFEVFGEVASTVLIRDRETRISKGYGFVKMPNSIEAERAIEEMHGREIAERTIIAKEANQKGNTTSSDKQNFVQVKFDRNTSNDHNSYHDKGNQYSEDIPLEVVDEVSFSTTELEDGLIQVKFNN